MVKLQSKGDILTPRRKCTIGTKISAPMSWLIEPISITRRHCTYSYSVPVAFLTEKVAKKSWQENCTKNRCCSFAPIIRKLCPHAVFVLARELWSEREMATHCYVPSIKLEARAEGKESENGVIYLLGPKILHLLALKRCWWNGQPAFECEHD